MIHTRSKQLRILALAPSAKGLGFAVLEKPAKLVDWGVKPATGNKNVHGLVSADGLLAHYQPAVLVLEDPTAPDVRRAPRIRTLHARLVAVATRRKVKVKLLTRTQVRRTFFGDDAPGTKQAIAEILATQFPEELGSRLPPKRRLWMSQNYRMDIFDAVALAVALQLPKQSRTDTGAERATGI